MKVKSISSADFMIGMLTFLLLLWQSTTYGQESLVGQIESILLYQPNTDVGERYDMKGKIEQLGSPDQVRTELISMLSKYSSAEPGTKEYVLLNGATSVLGDFREKQSIPQLSRNLFDKDVHENIRAASAKALGLIDPESNKQLLLKALSDPSSYFAIRVEAAEALAKTRDVESLHALEKYSREENDSHVKQKFERAARDLRIRIQRSR